MKYSVLMPVYAKENPSFFYLAVNSMMTQTVPPDEFVLVCDGPLTDALEKEIRRIDRHWQGKLTTIRLPECSGIGRALAVGVKACHNELIARMDSDDIACSNRCEKQLKQFGERMSKEKELALASGAIAEFRVGNREEKVKIDEAFPLPSWITGIRTLPCSYEDILTFARRRNPMNHMAVMMRKSVVLKVGNYRPISGAEDYELWVRILLAGYRAENLPDVLVYARTDNGMIGRRGGIGYAKELLKLQTHFYRIGFLSLSQYMVNCVVRLTASLIPVNFRSVLYQKILRSNGR